MKTKSIFALALGLSALATPAYAQSFAEGLESGNLGKAWPVGHKVPVLDAKKDPWRPVTAQEMTQAAGPKKGGYKMSAQVDYNGDGVTDTAYIARNSRQSAVLVQLGGGKGTVVAFRGNNPLLGGNELAAAGKRRIALNFPESSVVVLTAESGKPAVYYIGE